MSILKVVGFFILFTSFIHTQGLHVGDFYQDPWYTGGSTPAFVPYPTAAGTYSMTYNTTGLGYTSHHFNDFDCFYNPEYDGQFYLVGQKVTIYPKSIYDYEQFTYQDGTTIYIPKTSEDYYVYHSNGIGGYTYEWRDGLHGGNYQEVAIDMDYKDIWGYIYYWINETLSDNLQSLTYSYNVYPGAKLGIDYPSMNIGTVKGLSYIEGIINAKNVGALVMDDYVSASTAHWHYDLNLSTPYTYDDEYVIRDFLQPGQEVAIHFTGTAAKFAGPFVHTITINTYSCGSKTFYIYGNIQLPDFCNGETNLVNNSNEELIFDKEFIKSNDNLFNTNNNSKVKNSDNSAGLKSLSKSSLITNDASNQKTEKEKMKFAYDILKEKEDVKVADICKRIIKEYPNTEMGVSYYALDILWKLTESNDKNERISRKEHMSILEELYKPMKYNVNAWAGIMLSNFSESSKKQEILDNVFEHYKNTRFGEMALFLKFMNTGIDRRDSIKGRMILNSMDKYYPNSSYTYQAHMYFKDKGYNSKGYKTVVDKNDNEMEKRIKNFRLNKTEKNTEALFDVPTEFKLYANYPNPFNPSTTISFYIPKDDYVSVTIYNHCGQKIKELFSGSMPFGQHSLVWNGTNDQNVSVSSGIYFCTVKYSAKTYTNKMILQK